MGTKYASSSAHPTHVDSGFAGTLKNIQLNDLIQMCCLSTSSVCMRVTKDDRIGTIFIVDGEIVHAACEDVEGEEAFYRILGWQTGSFESIEVSTTPQRTIHNNYHYLIMEAARLVDEKAGLESAPSATAKGSREEPADDRLRVLIVDDSPMMRKILSSMLTASNRIKVVGMASNGEEAISLIDELSPDLVTLDVNMPVMDGTSTIKHIMIEKPCPVVITSNPGDGSSKAIFNFLELGAVDFMSKPTKNQDILVQQHKILERVRVAATATVGNFRIARIPTAKTGRTASKPIDRACHRLVIVISGPGGHLEQMILLSGLVPALAEKDGAVVAIQSLPSSFSEPFARYLFERCGCPASPIGHEASLFSGRCYVGNHGWPLAVKMNGDEPAIVPKAREEGLVQVDRLLTSAATVFKQHLAVVLLSGANTGEQSGLRVVHENGGRIILRKRSSGMVAEPLDQVVEAGLADEEVNPADLLITVLNGFGRNH
ncbi:response regulator [Desulfosarcina sp.]|uniref:response regulator n=1 Tax=Desulfosarcina sp. TaxID=2027861 RepID=UPI00356A499B